MRVIYARDAEIDLDEIVAFGAERWGFEQADYASRIIDAADRLADFPYVGRTADDVITGLRHLSVGSHVIYYVVEERQVTIARILHMSRDAQRYFR